MALYSTCSASRGHLPWHANVCHVAQHKFAFKATFDYIRVLHSASSLSIRLSVGVVLFGGDQDADRDTMHD